MSKKQPLIQQFGVKLNWLRTQHNLSMQQLASLLGYTSHGYISELEAGKKLPTVELVVKVARYFGVTTDVLLRDEIRIDVQDLTDDACIH